MALGNLIGGLFGKTKQKSIPASEEAAKLANEEAARMRMFGSTTRPAALADFSARLNASTPENEAVSSDLSKWYRDVMGKSGDYNPFETSVKPVADYAFGKLADFSQLIPSLTRRANNQNALNLGLAPGGKSSAVDRAQYSNAAAAFDKALGTLTPWMQSSAQLDATERNNAYLRALTASEQLKFEPDRLAWRALTPANVEAAGYGTDIANNQALINAARSNIMGYEANPNWAQRLGDADQQFTDNLTGMVGTAASAYGSMYGGGKGGNMYGGGTGGAAVPTLPSAPNYPTTVSWGDPQSQGPPSYYPWMTPKTYATSLWGD